MITEKEFNITAQICDRQDPYRQTILFNDIIHAENEQLARSAFAGTIGLTHDIIRIYSVCEIEK
jgi:hypothetical protein